VYSISLSDRKFHCTVSLINQYILRETLGAWIVVTVVLFVIVMTNQFAEILGEAASDQLPKDAVFGVLGLASLQYLTALTPIGLFLGVMLALARLNRDSEMSAIMACGIGPANILMPVSLLALVLSVGLAWLALVKTPEASWKIEEIKLQAREQLELGVLESGRFTTPDSGNTIIYAREVEGEQIRGVFIQRQTRNGVVVILADRGQRVQSSTDGQLTFVLYEGRRYEGVPGERNFKVTEFREHGIPIGRALADTSVELIEAKPTSVLFGSPDPEHQAELQWRFSSPISLLVLALLAVPLSRSRPQEGRYARLGVGVLVYVIYVNAMSVGRVWVEREQVPTWLGLWWVHLALGLLGLLLLMVEAGWLIPKAWPRLGKVRP